MRCFNYLLAIVALAFLHHPASCWGGGPNSPTWEFLEQANRAARESIRTLSCRVEWKNLTTETRGEKSFRMQAKETGLYYCSKDAVRVKILESILPGGVCNDSDSLWQNGIRKDRHRQVQKTYEHTSYGIDAISNRYWNFSDPFHCGLLVFTEPGGTQAYPIERWSQFAAKISKPEEVFVEGRKLQKVQLDFSPNHPGADLMRKDPWTVQVFFDPSVNYLVRKTISFTPQTDKTFRWERAVLEFKECEPGVFFPTRIKAEMQQSKGKTYTRTVDISEIDVNQLLPTDIFVFRFPHGVEVGNGIRRTSYPSDAEGNPIGKETPMGRMPPLPPGNPMTETEEEPQSSWWRWVLWIALICLAAGIVVRLYRSSRGGFNPDSSLDHAKKSLR